MSLASVIADAAAELAALLSETCAIAPVQADGTYGAAVPVACAIVQPTAAQGPHGGGGGLLARPGDQTVMLPRGTVVAAGDRITRGADTYSVASVVTPKSHDPLLYAQVVETD